MRRKPRRAKIFRNGGSQAVRPAKGWTPEFTEMFFRGPPLPDAFPDRPPQGELEERDLTF